MKIGLTGGTGFTGGLALMRLLAAGHAVRCLVRRREAVAVVQALGAEAFLGDLADGDAFTGMLRGCDALVNVASLGFGHADGIIAAAKAAGVQRAVFVSTTAIFTSLNAPSKTMRIAAEAAVQRSGLDWTILRPTMIYGTVRDRNMYRLIRFLRRSPVLPVFGSGESLMQPVYVEDLASAICTAVTAQSAVNHAYNVSGAAALTYNDIVRTVARLMGHRVWIWHLPCKPAVGALSFAERRRIRLPLKAEQILRLQEDKVFGWDEAARDFGYSPRTFEAGMRLELESLGLLREAGV